MEQRIFDNIDYWLLPEPDDGFSDDEDFCPYCYGEGYGYQCELEFDWVNRGELWIVCPYCNGTGRE